MTVTMKKVARRAGVSISTVSRVCSGRPMVKEESVRKVKQVMEELGYTPNRIAQSLVSRSANCLCLLLPLAEQPVFAKLLYMEMARGIIAEAACLGYDIQISSGMNEQEELEAVSGLLKGRRVDGVILLHSGGEKPLISYLKGSGYPFVVAECPGAEAVQQGDAMLHPGTYEAVNQLIAGGCQSGTLAVRALTGKIRSDHWECKYG
ncbi:LacI family DNA-binding transcriptional regulator [Paenibacillus sp. MMS20-IR301]|uniref:LacI family DNA-binding transcriptional regulator n=1 Tax=Paenibacillus sp. MMS20-IR301 TaxID=2895946 RepID=UPI0028E277DA|nr:LacI family DNA-binding transcriptional regulator [Paenibacillus sp. MMS20-IR301]WNS44214.1 LacI family DNA-binding transcriptional regulator [Paenibacillus sp. MMS20-IR301]